MLDKLAKIGGSKNPVQIYLRNVLWVLVKMTVDRVPVRLVCGSGLCTQPPPLTEHAASLYGIAVFMIGSHGALECAEVEAVCRHMRSHGGCHGTRMKENVFV